MPITNCHNHIGGRYDSGRETLFDDKRPVDAVRSLRSDVRMVPIRTRLPELQIREVM